MPRPPIDALEPSTPLSALLRAAPPGEVCGVWVRGHTGPGRALGAAEPGQSGHLLLVHGDLGALLRRVPRVAVWFEGRVEVMPASVLALCRLLDFLRSDDVPRAPRRRARDEVDAPAMRSLG